MAGALEHDPDITRAPQRIALEEHLLPGTSIGPLDVAAGLDELAADAGDLVIEPLADLAGILGLLRLLEVRRQRSVGRLVRQAPTVPAGERGGGAWQILDNLGIFDRAIKHERDRHHESEDNERQQGRHESERTKFAPALGPAQAGP